MESSPNRRSGNPNGSGSSLGKGNIKSNAKGDSKKPSELTTESRPRSPSGATAKETTPTPAEAKDPAKKVETQANTAARQRSVNRMHSKIPKKCVTRDAISSARPAPKSPSKLTVNFAELGKKLDTPRSSKSNIKTIGSLKSPFSGVNKAMTPREVVGIGSGRSATFSAISYKPLYRPGSTDALLGAVKKTKSSSGDQEIYGLNARERVAENNKLKVFEDLHKKLQVMQSDFMQKFENLKLSSPDKIKNDYKFISIIKNDECKLIIAEEDQLRMPKRLPASSLNDFKEKIRNALENSLHTLLDNLDKEKNYDNQFPNLVELQCNLERKQQQQLYDIYEAIHDMCTAKDGGDNDGQIVAMQKEIQEGKRTVSELEKKIGDIIKQHADELSAREIAESDMMKRDMEFAEMTKKVKMLEKLNEKFRSKLQQSNEDRRCEEEDKTRLEEDLKACKENLHCMVKKLAHADSQLAHDKKEKQDQMEVIHKLEIDLNAADRKIEDMLSNRKREQSTNGGHDNEMTELRMQVNCLEREKMALENQLEKLGYENIMLCDLQNKLAEADARIEELEILLDERNSEFSDKAEIPKELTNELSKLKQSEIEKRREIDKLRGELSKTQFTVSQMEQQVQRDQQLLEVRNELINSLQSNHADQRIHLEEMFSQIAESNGTIAELNSELRAKAEEFRNLFSTLSNKQMEVSRQEHMIKLLEESNARGVVIRLKQEDKIGHMEEEITRLKHTVGDHLNISPRTLTDQNLFTSVPNNTNLYIPVSASEERHENLYYYTTRRRRKRQSDVIVRRYDS